MDTILSYIPESLMGLDMWKNILYIINITIIAYLILTVLDDKKKQERALGRAKRKKKMNTSRKNVIYFGKLKKNIHTFFMKKEMPGFILPIYYFVIFVPLGIGGYFFYEAQYFLGFVAIFATYFLIQKIFDVVQDDIDDKIEEGLPIVIDNVIKTYSKYGDLKTVINEAARTAPEPLHTHLNTLGRRLVTEDPEKCLNDFAEELDNTWIYSFIFILSSYKGTTKKADVLANLADLRNVVDEENRLKRQSATDRQYGMVVNYFLIITAILASFGHIMWNPVGKSYFFESLQGLMVFIAGYSCVFGTIIINLNMKKKKGRRN